MALIDDDMKKEASDMFQSLMKDGFHTSLDLTFVDRISQKLENVFPNPTRQVKLCLQYVRMINILNMSKAAERTGNWEGYLCVLRQMIPFLAASEHNHYTRSVRWFLQNMMELPVTHPTLYTIFMNGFFVVRQSDQYWTGISPDLCIEQSLLCSLKSPGGLTRGRGMDEIT